MPHTQHLEHCCRLHVAAASLPLQEVKHVLAFQLATCNICHLTPNALFLCYLSLLKDGASSTDNNLFYRHVYPA
jgi:hypothetical protein